MHIPKTAGTSISQRLYGCEITHRPALDLAILYPLRFARLKKFAVVREPVERFLSAYDYLKNGGKNAQDREFGGRYVEPFDTADAFIAACRDERFKANVFRYVHFKTQTYYVAWRGRCLVNRLARFDRVVPDVADILGEDIALPARNVTDGKRTTPADLSPQTIRAIEEAYRDDFRLWRVASKSRGDLFLQPF